MAHKCNYAARTRCARAHLLPSTPLPGLSPLYRLAPADILVGQPIDQPMRQIDGEGRLVRFALALLLFGHSMLEFGLNFGQLKLEIVNFQLEIL